MKLHLPYLLRRAVVRALFAAATVVTTLASATHADMITPDGRTATQVIQSGNVYDVYTNTVRGNTGFNSFSTFDVYAETTANLHLADGTGRLINVVRDSASHIDGVLNSYKDGRIGGDVYFLNPHGIIVGKSGVINVGSISMSTPTAAFVEQLIARDGSISPTATQAVLAGDMPINEKGTISIKGKVNSAGNVELRTGKAEVPEGKVRTGVKFGEMVNTGGRKVDTQGMSIQNGKLSFGATPAKESAGAETEPPAETEVQAPEETEETEETPGISIFANEALVSGDALDSGNVLLDLDKVRITGTLSGDYTAEGREIIVDGASSDDLDSLTLTAANELSDGFRYAGNVSITFVNSHLEANSMCITADATMEGYTATISVADSSLTTEYMGSALGISASTVDGAARVEIGGGANLWGIDSVGVTAISLKGDAAVTLDANAEVTADSVSLAAFAVEGAATLTLGGTITGGNSVDITASTGMAVSDFTEDTQISDVNVTHEGGGNAKVEVTGDVSAKGALSVTAAAQGTNGNAAVRLEGKLHSEYDETKPVGDLAFERTGILAINEEDSEDEVSWKNGLYLDAYTEYLKELPKATAPTATINVTASAVKGDASISQAAQSELHSNLSAALSADASNKAEINLEGKVSSGDVAASATGKGSAELKVGKDAELQAAPHLSFVRDGMVNSVEESNGSIMLTAGTAYNETEQPDSLQAPVDNTNARLVVEGSLNASRGGRPLIMDGSTEGGYIYLGSEGSLSVGDSAKLTATSGCGTGGTIVLDATRYTLGNPANFSVNGLLISTPGSIVLMNHKVLTGEDINRADDIARSFVRETLGGNDTNDEIDYNTWKGGFSLITLQGNILLDKNFNASIGRMAIADNTKISGDPAHHYNLILTEHSSHNFQLHNNRITIGNNVSITNVGNFSIRYRNHSVANILCNSYIADHTVMSVGENFTVDATGNVSITVQSPGYTFLTFAKGLNINAGGDVTISATTTNGYGTSMLTSALWDPVAAIMRLVPQQKNPQLQDFINWMKQSGIVKFNIEKFTHKILARLFSKDGKGKNLYMPQVGVRVSQAAITFAQENAGSIKGNSVTIASKSTADVSGRKKWSNDFVGASVGYTYNSSKVDLGKNLTITATGFKEVHPTQYETIPVSVSITSTTSSKNSLAAQFTSEAETLAFGAQVAVVHDYNTLTIDKSVKIEAKKDIDITAKSDITAAPFLSLDSSGETKVSALGVEETGTPARVALTMGVNLIIHKSNTKVDGTLVSSDGSISVKSEDSISSSLTMNSGVSSSLVKWKPNKSEADNFWQFFKDTLRECVVIDLGVCKRPLTEDAQFKWLMDRFLPWVDKPGDLYKKLFQNPDDPSDKPRVALGIASDIVVTDNNLTFNGTADARYGSVTLDASTEVEAACGAETSIVGVPTKAAVAGSISVPVISGNTTTEVGSDAVINAGAHIGIHSSTELPLSADFLGWNAWRDFVKNQVNNPAKDTSKFLAALRASLKFIEDYQDNGELGILDSLTSSHASTILSKTGDIANQNKAVGGSVVVDLRNFNTKTIIRDNALLTTGNTLSVDSSSKGIQVTFSGQIPFFLTLSNPPQYRVKHTAASGFGFSVIVGQKTLNTITYIGAARLEAGELEVDSAGDVFMLEMGLGGNIGNSGTAMQGGVNVIVEDKMTVSEISGGADITLTGDKTKDSSITATDASTLINISGLAADGAKNAIGFGVAVTVNNAFTAAMLGNNLPITASYSGAWDNQMGKLGLKFARPEAITLRFDRGSGNLSVKGADRATLVNVGLAGAVQRKQNGEQGEVEPDEGDNGGAALAANVGVTYNHAETVARQYKVFELASPGSPSPQYVPVTGDGSNAISTKAWTDSTIVAVSGDADVNVTGTEDTAMVAGALSINIAKMDAKADVTDCEYTKVGDFTVDTHDNSTVVAVDAAFAAGAAKAGVAAGISWNVLTGNTASLLSGGAISAENVSVTSATNLTSLTCTLGGAIDFRPTTAHMNQVYEMMMKVINEPIDVNNSNNLENNLREGSNYIDDELFDFLNDEAPSDAGIPVDDLGSLALGEDPSVLDGDGGNEWEFELGATIARNALTMRSSAIVEGCAVTTPGEFKVTANDTSVITAVSVAASIKKNGKSVGAGAVLSFAPVASVTEAVIRQKAGASQKLAIEAGSLTLQAKDKHRERVWSFGGGYADSDQLNLVLAWGSFAGNGGGKTVALIENVDAKVASKVDILSSADLDATFISVGGSGSSGTLSLNAMVNYLNFNNQVMADIKGSNLTVTAADGKFKALAENKRTFTDGVGALSLTLNDKKVGCGGGGAFSFLYLGGNGKDDTNLTALTVSNSTINNSGTTELLANSTTKGILAGANAVSQGNLGDDAFGLAFTGSVSWLSDASFTQVDIKDSYFNKRDLAVDADKKAVITVDAASGSDLTFGFGSLGVRIGKVRFKDDAPNKSLAFGFSFAKIKDAATTAATMTGGGVGNARDFTLHSSGKADMGALLIGGGGGDGFGIAGGALTADITHNVASRLEKSVVNLNGALTINAENSSNIGRNKGTRFTIANAALGVTAGAAAADVNFINVADIVTAKALNDSVKAGAMTVNALENSDVDLVTVNVAGGKYGTLEANIVRPLLKGTADASIVSTTTELDDQSPVEVVLTRHLDTDADGAPYVTSGSLTVNATNNQWMRSNLWCFDVSISPFSVLSGAGMVCVNSTNMVGGAHAGIEGDMPITIDGNLDINATSDRYATYTTVAVAVALAKKLSVAANLSFTSLLVSPFNSGKQAQDAIMKAKNAAAEEIDKQIGNVYDLIRKAGVKPDKDTMLTLSGDIKNSMSTASKAIDDANTTASTTATLDLHGQTAKVGGNISILSSDEIATDPLTVPVTGGVFGASVNKIDTVLQSIVETNVMDTVLDAGSNITIDAAQFLFDAFTDKGVKIGLLQNADGYYKLYNSGETTLKVDGSKTKLNSKSGSIKIGTVANLSQNYTHTNFYVGGTIGFVYPSSQLRESSRLTIGEGIGITAENGLVSIVTESHNLLNVATLDASMGLGDSVLTDTTYNQDNTQDLMIGDNVNITGGSVFIGQNCESNVGMTSDHLTGEYLLSVSCPAATVFDTTRCTLQIGNGNKVTATTGDLTIESFGNAASTYNFAGVHLFGVKVGVAIKAHWVQPSVDSKVELGNNVELKAEKGDMTVRSESDQKIELRSCQLASNGASLSDVVASEEHSRAESSVTIGTGFKALGNSLALESITRGVFSCEGVKVTISGVLNAYSRNSFVMAPHLKSTITLAGGDIKVKKFTAKALTDANLKAYQLLAGGSITVDVNTGKVEPITHQTAEITLGTGENQLDILTDDISVNSHNKFLLTPIEGKDSMVSGADFAVGFGTSIGNVDSLEEFTSTVTLGRNAHVLRRGDAAHYMNRNDYSAIFSATNNVESNVMVALKAYGVLNANCRVTTNDITTVQDVTHDETNTSATLNILGTIDTWGNTELTAYSHARHDMTNSVVSGAIIPSHRTTLTNTIKTVDTVNIKGAVESIGDILIQAGSTNDLYTMVDGDKVVGGRDDTNTTRFAWGCDNATISNTRTENLNIYTDVRAGGELIISNDSSLNTSAKPFKQTKKSGDYQAAAIDIAANVTSNVTLGNNVNLYAGLAAANQMLFRFDLSKNVMDLQFTSAQKIFENSTRNADKGIWIASGNDVKELYSLNLQKGSELLSINEVTVPGMAFRIDTKAKQSLFKDRLYSPTKHGLDILVAAEWRYNVQTTGVTLLGHESGLIFNRKAVTEAGTVKSCSAAEHLYLNEGVSIRSVAGGDLYLTGYYLFPYSTFNVSSARDLVIKGFVLAGATTLQADGNISYDNPDAEYAVGRSALSMYSKLFEDWEATIQPKVAADAEKIAVASGNHEHKVANPQPGVYTTKDYSDYFTDGAIKDAVKKAVGEGISTPTIAAGMVYIKAKVVDLNGQIFSGLQSPSITIGANPTLLTSTNERITVAKADELYGMNHLNRIFRLDGCSGVSIVYDADTHEFSLNNYTTLPTGIYIEGIIVNTDPLGNSGLYIAGATRPLKITNDSKYKLNIGNVDMTTGGSQGITLKNTGNGTTTTYTQDAQGKWKMNVLKGDGSLTTSNLGAKPDFTYTNVADYQFVLHRVVDKLVIERGRLEHKGSKPPAYVKKGYKCTTPGWIGDRRTFIDSFAFENASGPLPIESTGFAWEYVPRKVGDDSTRSGAAVSKHSIVTPRELFKDLFNPSATERYKYELHYTERSDDTLYISAANPVAIHVGSNSPTELNISGGDVNFTGQVKTPVCRVETTGSITATVDAHIDSGTIYMRAGGDIGSAEQALSFSAGGSGEFRAAQDLYLAARKDAQLNLEAGNTLSLLSSTSISNIVFRSEKGDAFIEAAGNISMTGLNKSHAKLSTTLISDTGAITVENSTDNLGILTAIAEGDVRFNSSSGDTLSLRYVDSHQGEVKIGAQNDIITVTGSNMSSLYAVPGSKSLSLSAQLDASLDDLSDDYYDKLVYYEKLYYEKDRDGNYINRMGDTFILPEEHEALTTLSNTFRELYDEGQGDYLAALMYSLSGTPAVGGRQFNTVLEAAHFLAENGDKLDDFAVGYYNKLVDDVTKEVKALHGVEELPVGYCGEFGEDTYRLYWLKDAKGDYVNRDEAGNFINPERKDAFGNVIGTLYDPKMCEAITNQFKGTQDLRGKYEPQKSVALANLSSAASGNSTVQLKLGLEAGNVAALAGGRPIGESQVTIHAAKGVSLNAGENKNVGGGTFNFNICPIGMENGSPVYSDWANIFLKQYNDKQLGKQYSQLRELSHNEETGVYSFALSSFDTNLDHLDALQIQLLQQVVPMDIIQGRGFFHVNVRGYVCVALDEGDLHVTGNNVMLSAMQDINLSDGGIQANNLFLSTTGAITGSLKGKAGENGLDGTVILHADGGFGTAQEAFNISGGSTVFSLLSDQDVYLKTDGDIKLATLQGNYVTIDASQGDLLPARNRDLEANITGRRVNFRGNLDKGLSFSTFGTSEEEGGLHWYGGTSPNIKGEVYNTVYKFWFKREGDNATLDSIDIGYSGHLVLDGLQEIKDATFRQVGTASGMSILEFAEAPAFADSLTFDGAGAYTVISPGKLTLGSASGLHVGGDATLRFAGIGSADGSPIHIIGTGNLTLCNSSPDSTCLVENGLVIDSAGTISLNAVTSGGALTLNGRRGVAGEGVIAPRIVANSSAGGVFLNADTEDLSGSSWNSFVVDLESLGNDNSVRVHDINANAMTARVVIRSLSNELELDGTISGTALLFYSTGDILRDANDILDSDYPFLDIWLSNDPEVEKMNMGQFRADLPESFVWLMEESYDDASKSGDDAAELRRKVDGEYDIPTLQPLRFTDKDGNTVSREQYANLITTNK